MSSTGERELVLGLEALRLAMRGYGHAAIAAELRLPSDTVKGRLRRLYTQLGARNAAHAVAIAGVEGLLSRDDLRAAVADRRPGWTPRAVEEEG